MKKSRLYAIGLITLIGFPLIGATIVGIVESDPTSFTWDYHWHWGYQLLAGLAFGLLAGFLAWQLIQQPFMLPVRNRYGKLIQSMRMNWADILFLSFCAGVGEEILFRGVIQPYWGIWPTSLFFVFIHGYLNPLDKRITAYGIFMTLVIVIIGKLTLIAGLPTAMAAHFAIDVVLLRKLTTADYGPEEAQDENNNEDSDAPEPLD